MFNTSSRVGLAPGECSPSLRVDMLIGRALAGSSPAMVNWISCANAADLRVGEGSGVYGQTAALVGRCEVLLLIALAWSPPLLLTSHLIDDQFKFWTSFQCCSNVGRMYRLSASIDCCGIVYDALEGSYGRLTGE